MKKVFGIVTVFLIMAMTTTVFAQNADKWAKKASQEVAAMTEVMKLDATQQTKMTNLLTEVFTERVTAKQKEGDERKQAMKAVNKKQNDGMAAICTPEQLDLWKKHLEASKTNQKKKE